MNLIKLWDLNGNEISLKKYGLIGLRLLPSSPSYTSTNETIPGRPGSVNMGKDLNARNLTALFIAEAYDYSDSIMLRDDIYKLFSEKMYIGETRLPGKYWLVESLNEWEPERLNIFSSSIELSLTAEKGMAESVGTTMNLFEWDADLWQWGMGIPYDDYSYEHSTNQFVIYNAGNETVDPRNKELKITIKATASSYIEIINHTTGETYRYNGALTPDDALVIDKIRTTKNSLSAYRDTNKKLIKLLPGENDIEVKGATVEFISFDFRFLYL